MSSQWVTYETEPRLATDPFGDWHCAEHRKPGLRCNHVAELQRRLAKGDAPEATLVDPMNIVLETWGLGAKPQPKLAFDEKDNQGEVPIPGRLTHEEELEAIAGGKKGNRPEPSGFEVAQLAAPFRALLAPFPPEQVDKLPKGIRKDADKQDCSECGGYHPPAQVHLDYVGHANVTKRLLEVDPLWNWEPQAFTEEGLPLFVIDRGEPVGFWIRLTVLGVTRLGFGSVEPGTFDAEKQLIGDALRNAAMRFGVAIDLWTKHDTAEGKSPTSKATRSRSGGEKAQQDVPPWFADFNKRRGDLGLMGWTIEKALGGAKPSMTNIAAWLEEHEVPRREEDGQFAPAQAKVALEGLLSKAADYQAQQKAADQ